MSNFDESNEANWVEQKSLSCRENYYEQKRKLHTVWNLNYAPSCDSREDKLALSGSQVQLSFDMGYRLAMTQVKQYIEITRAQVNNQETNKYCNKIVKFTDDRIEDSFCLHYFKGQYEELIKSKEAHELDAHRNWIDCPEYEYK